ncbi:pyruvate kinase [Patescibacteria group bacterium]
MNQTKIVCTIGPVSEEKTVLISLIKSGMNMARINLSHGTHQGHQKLIKVIKGAAKETKKTIGIIGDLQGPKIRLGKLPTEGVELKDGQVVFFPTLTKFQPDQLPVTYNKLAQDLKKGHRILIDDGLVELEVVSVKKGLIKAQVINGGKVTSNKGMNFPDSTLSLSSLTKKDKQDIVFALEQGLDWLALSFATGPDDVLTLRRLIKRASKPGQVLPRVMVKIEKHEAITNFDQILKVADGIMIARGDLGIEIPAETVPVHQIEMIEKCRHAGKPVNQNA